MEIEVGSGRLHLSYRAESFIHRCRHSRRFVPLVCRFVLCYPERIMKKIIIGLAAAALMFGVLASPISARAFSVADSALIQSLLRTLIDLQNQLINLLTRQNPPADPTAGWQTYRNEEYGFEIQHPSEVTIRDVDSTGGRTISFEFPSSSTRVGMSKSVRIGVANSHWRGGMEIAGGTCDDFDKEATSANINGVIFSQGDVSGLFGGMQTAGKVIESCAVRGGISYKLLSVIQYARYTTQFTNADFESERHILERVISTFKFTPTTGSTVGWKMYRDGKYGYHIRYPQDWVLATASPSGDLVNIVYQVPNKTYNENNPQEVKIQIQANNVDASRPLISYVDAINGLTGTANQIQSVTVNNYSGFKTNEVGNGVYYLKNGGVLLKILLFVNQGFSAQIPGQVLNTISF